MVRSYNHWIFTKTRGFCPKGSLQLGQILSEPFDPASSLMPGGPPPIPSDILQEHTSQDSVTINSMDDLMAVFGLWAKATGLPVGFQAEGGIDRSNKLSWTFKKLSSKIMSPSIDYTRTAMQHGDVPERLKRWSFRRRVYMITGVRTAHGARMVDESSKSVNLQLQAEADASSAGAPVTAGGKAGLSTTSSSTTSFEKASNFVFAYRLNEVRYRGRLTQEPFKQGETSAVGVEDTDKGDATKEETQERMELHVEGVEGEDFDGAESKCQRFVIECLMPA